MARTHVGRAVGAGDGAPFVGADRVDRRERGLGRARQQEHAGDRLDQHGAADRGQRGPGDIDVDAGAREASGRHAEIDGAAAGRRRRVSAAAATRKHRRERGAGGRLTGSRAEPASGKKYTRCRHYLLPAPLSSGADCSDRRTGKIDATANVRDLRSVAGLRRRVITVWKVQRRLRNAHGRGQRTLARH